MRTKNKKGFTLVELLAVIVILAVIAIIAIPTIIDAVTKAQLKSSEASMDGYVKAVNNASSIYELKHGVKPEKINNLEVEAQNIEKIDLISLRFNESGDVQAAKAMVNGFYCIYKDNAYTKCLKGKYAYIKNIYNLTDINKESIQNICFVDDKRGSIPIDISVDGNQSVLLYLEENGNIINNVNMYDAYIYSELIISPPQDSSNFFKNLTYLDSLNFNDMFDTSNVTNMNNMFENVGRYSKVFTLDLGNYFDTSKVTSMQSMFSRAIQENPVFILKLGKKFDTSNVTRMQSMFLEVGINSKVFTLDLGDKFNTSNVGDMWFMFHYAGGRSETFTLDLGENFDTSKVVGMTNMFNGLGNSAKDFTLDLGNHFKFKSNVTIKNFVTGCGASKLIIPSTVTNIPAGAFNGMKKLTQIVFEHSASDTITLPAAGSETGAFYYSSNINTTVTTKSNTIKNYDWLSDNRTVNFK